MLHLQGYQNIRGKPKRHGDRDESIFPLYFLYPLWPFSLSFEIYEVIKLKGYMEAQIRMSRGHKGGAGDGFEGDERGLMFT